MAIYIIRHGETALNAARVVQPADTPLSERGFAQAERVARRLASVNITNILSSDQPRALQTAEVIQRATGALLETDGRLQERNYGDIRGRSYAEIGLDIHDPAYDPPGGETWGDFFTRVASVWPVITAAARAAGGELAVVTHGLVCHALALHHLTFPAGIVAPTRWGNTAVTIVENRPPWTVRSVGCTAHLDSATADDRLAVSGT